ncbi:hypothetical protein ANANG_G00064910 [Anguilla anguilla]|uniref:Uncharacterized protein n=1 Tax=Anguilla anguilla TaxID=7936 RepID=A0A9D3S2V8_ANGAN|nr:hypothetical protein ANANG_G00064910 [Anguilla anguilla]
MWMRKATPLRSERRLEKHWKRTGVMISGRMVRRTRWSAPGEMQDGSVDQDTRRTSFDSGTLKEQDRPTKIIEAYPCFKDLKHVLDELGRIIDSYNPNYLSKVKERCDSFQTKATFYGVMKKLMKPQVILSDEEKTINLSKALPAMFPSSTGPSKKLRQETL